MTHAEKRYEAYFTARKAIQVARWAAHHRIDAEADEKINALAREFFGREAREMERMERAAA